MPPVGALSNPTFVPPALGELVVLECLPDSSSGARCHVCCGFFQFLGRHLSMAHSLTVDPRSMTSIAAGKVDVEALELLAASAIQFVR